jgi:hypothetical protein
MFRGMRGIVRPADRVVVAVIGAFDVFAGWRFSQTADLTPVPLGRAWPYVFIAAGILTLALEFAFTNRTLLALSGSIGITAYVSRSLLVFVAMTRGDADVSDERAQVGIAVWLLLGWMVGYIWIRVLRPLSEVRRRVDPGLRS